MIKADQGRKLIEELVEAEVNFHEEVNPGYNRSDRNHAEKKLIAARGALEKWLETL